MTKTDSQLAIVAFAYDSNTKGNAATEIVKYFLQQHYNLGVDLTRPDLLQRTTSLEVMATPAGGRRHDRDARRAPVRWQLRRQA